MSAREWHCHNPDCDKFGAQTSPGPLYALRRCSPVYELRAGTDHAVIVTASTGREWIIDTTGRTLAVKGTVS